MRSPKNIGGKFKKKHRFAFFLLIHQKKRRHRADAEDP
jgi:hypothetical protein